MQAEREDQAPGPPRFERFGLACAGAGALALLFAQALAPAFEARSPVVVGVATLLSLGRMLAFHAGLPLLVLAGALARARRWRLVFAGLPLLLLCWGPTLWEARPRPREEPAGPELTVFSANVLMINRDTQGILGEVRAAQPDLVFLQEVSSPWSQALLDRDLLQTYPHRRVVARRDSFGVALLSRRPLLRCEVFTLGGVQLPMLRAEVEHAGRRVAVYDVHLLPPRRPDYLEPHRRMHAALLAKLEQEELPVVLAGDFNFSGQSPHADALEALGFVDVLDQAGWGRETTWPRALPGLLGLRLDHIYLRDLRAHAAHVGEGRGSDHRPVVARVSLRQD